MKQLLADIFRYTFVKFDSTNPTQFQTFSSYPTPQEMLSQLWVRFMFHMFFDPTQKSIDKLRPQLKASPKLLTTGTKETRWDKLRQDTRRGDGDGDKGQSQLLVVCQNCWQCPNGLDFGSRAIVANAQGITNRHTQFNSIQPDSLTIPHSHSIPCTWLCNEKSMLSSKWKWKWKWKWDALHFQVRRDFV